MFYFNPANDSIFLFGLTSVGLITHQSFLAAVPVTKASLVDSQISTAATVSGKTNSSTIICSYFRTFEKFFFGILGSRSLAQHASFKSTLHNYNFSLKAILGFTGHKQMKKSKLKISHWKLLKDETRNMFWRSWDVAMWLFALFRSHARSTYSSFKRISKSFLLNIKL